MFWKSILLMCLSSPAPKLSMRELISESFTEAPYINPDSEIEISSSVLIKDDICEIESASSYEAAFTSFKKTTLQYLVNATFNFEDVRSLSGNKYIARWNVSYIPDTTAALWAFGGVLPGVERKYYNLLDREDKISSFSWIAFSKFLIRIVTKGEYMVPLAVIKGQSELTFENIDQ